MSKKDPWIICPVCEGDGTTVNPSIDAHGLTHEDFADDPDFAEDYMSVTYDVPCGACDGLGRMRKSHQKELYEAADARRLAAREDGDWDAYRVAGDYRYGTKR